jgi:hypothetical protein
MLKPNSSADHRFSDRRSFLKGSAALTAGFSPQRALAKPKESGFQGTIN